MLPVPPECPFRSFNREHDGQPPPSLKSAEFIAGADAGDVSGGASGDGGIVNPWAGDGDVGGGASGDCDGGARGFGEEVPADGREGRADARRRDEHDGFHKTPQGEDKGRGRPLVIAAWLRAELQGLPADIGGSAASGSGLFLTPLMMQGCRMQGWCIFAQIKSERTANCPGVVPIGRRTAQPARLPGELTIAPSFDVQLFCSLHLLGC
jgi:hypothetical protein